MSERRTARIPEVSLSVIQRILMHESGYIGGLEGGPWLWPVRRDIAPPLRRPSPDNKICNRSRIPSCRLACPAGVNIEGYVALIAEGKFKEALERVRLDIPFPAVCGRVCFHPCELKCERGKFDEPIAINALKRFAADFEAKESFEKVEAQPRKYEEKVAVIGSGPAGLTAAHDLVKMGYPVTVFEAMPELGGMLRYGIPEYRLHKKVLAKEVERIKDLGVEMRTNTTVGKDITFSGLLRKFKAVFIAVGAQTSGRLGIEGEDLEGVVHALDYLKEVNSGRKVFLGNRVAVIGGGNVAVDAARTALRLGAREVSIVYRRSRKEMPANPEETEQAKKEGARLRFLASPTRIVGEDGKVVGLECIRMELGKPDESGRRQPIPIKGSEYITKLDAVILAIGELPDVSFVPKTIEISRKSTIVVDPVTLETSEKGVFAGGDVVLGPATVIEAIASGKRAAISIHRYLRGQDLKEEREEEVKKVEVFKEGVEKRPRQVMPTLPLSQRIENFKEVELGFTEKMAVEEAKRCLACGECGLCIDFCPEGIIFKAEKGVDIDFTYCKGCMICVNECIPRAMKIIE